MAKKKTKPTGTKRSDKNRKRLARRTEPKPATRDADLPLGPVPGPGADSEQMHGQSDFFDRVDAALSDVHPLPLLSLVSVMLAAFDPRDRSPLDGPDDLETAQWPEFVDSLLDTNVRASTAVLTVLGEMSRDEFERARIRRELRGRRHPLPPWLRAIANAAPTAAATVKHVLGDGDNVMVEVSVPSSETFTVVIYVDHNLGSAVKDAFERADPLATLLDAYRDLIDVDSTIVDISLADARACLGEAIEMGATIYPPLESDTWPASRPMVEWILSKMPAGGTGYSRPEWSDSDLEALRERFLRSWLGAGNGDADWRSIVNSLLRFGTENGPGDPLRWSPTSVEIVLEDWIPRTVIAEQDYLAKVPDVLRAFVRFAHDERGISADLTRQTLEAVDVSEPEFLSAIDSSDEVDADDVLAALGGPSGARTVDDEKLAEFAEMLADATTDSLEAAVGGPEALEKVDEAPLLDESFVWEGIPDDVHERVGEVLDLVDRCSDELFDTEFRTACRRFLSRIASGDPAIFRRKGAAKTAAAAICWIIGRANFAFDGEPSRIRVHDLMAHFGVKGSVSGRADVLMRAAGIAHDGGPEIELGTPDLLISSRRGIIVDFRDHPDEIARALVDKLPDFSPRDH